MQDWGPSMGHHGPSWGHLGATSGPSWGHRAVLGHLGAILGPSWAFPGPSGATLGPPFLNMDPSGPPSTDNKANFALRKRVQVAQCCPNTTQIRYTHLHIRMHAPSNLFSPHDGSNMDPYWPSQPPKLTIRYQRIKYQMR